MTDLLQQKVLDQSWWGHIARDGGPVSGPGQTKANRMVTDVTVEGIAKRAMVMWAPGATGQTFSCFEVELPQDAAALSFEMGLPAESGSARPDATVIYSVRAIDEQSGDKLVWEGRYGQARWQPVTVDLHGYAGQKVTLRLINSWDAQSKGYKGPACWADVRVLGP